MVCTVPSSAAHTSPSAPQVVTADAVIRQVPKMRSISCNLLQSSLTHLWAQVGARGQPQASPASGASPALGALHLTTWQTQLQTARSGAAAALRHPHPMLPPSPSPDSRMTPPWAQVSLYMHALTYRLQSRRLKMWHTCKAAVKYDLANAAGLQHCMMALDKRLLARLTTADDLPRRYPVNATVRAPATKASRQ